MAKDSLTVTDNRTGRTCELPILKALNLSVVMAIVGLALVFGTAPASAQSSADPHHQPAAAPRAAPDGMQPPQGDGMMPMMDMCRQMMSGSMGMAAEKNMDPKMMAHMLEMRGEMMKAMGDVMMKHGKMMQGDAMK